MDANEIKERCDRMQREIEGLHDRLSTHAMRIAEVEKNHSINDVVMSNVDRRLEGIEDSLKWIVKLIIGAILTGLISAIVALAFSGGV